jgi:eukaryotic-like serine/threonine-protein kinase
MSQPSDSSITPLTSLPSSGEKEGEIVDALRQMETLPVVPAAEVNEAIARLQQLADEDSPNDVRGHQLQYVGDYQLIEEIGRGGMGVVYRAEQLTLQRQVAIKMVLAGPFVSPEVLSRFRTEAKAAGSLDHPNIVPVYEVGEHLGLPYFSMKLVAGKSLSQLASNFSLSVDHSGSERGKRSDRIALLVLKIASAVHYAHQRGVLHRDLKPSNVLIDENEEPYVTDFGLAKLLDGSANVTTQGALLGTPSYMAPEQAAGADQVTTAADVYGVGGILYELLTGKAPYKGTSSVETLRLVRETEIRPPRSLNPAIDRDLETICMKCMSREPGDRYASAAAVADDLQRYLNREPIQARRISAAERFYKWARRRPSAAALLIGSLLASVLLLVGFLVSYSVVSRARENAEQALAREKHGTYIKTVALAYRDLVDGNAAHARTLLDSCDPAERDWEWNYLHARAWSDYKTLAPKLTQPLDEAFSPDGKFFAVLAFDHAEKEEICYGYSVQVWSTETWQEVAFLEPPEDHFYAPVVNWPKISFSSDSTQLAIPIMARRGDTEFCGIRRWDTRTWAPLPTLPEELPDRIILGVVYDEQNACLGVTMPFALRDLDREKTQMTLTNFDDGSTRGTFQAAEGQMDATGSPDGRWFSLTHVGLSIHESKSGDVVVEIPHPRICIAAAFHPQGHTLAALDVVGTLTLYELPSGNEIREWQAHEQYGWEVKFMPDGERLLTTGTDGWVRVWRVADGKELESALGQGGVAASPHDSHLAVFRSEQQYFRWNLEGATRLHASPLSSERFISDLTVSREGRWCASVEGLHHIDLWDVPARRLQTRFNGVDRASPGHVVRSVQLNSEGTRLAALLGERGVPKLAQAVRVWDLPDGKLVRDIAVPQGQRRTMAWSPDGEVLVVGGSDSISAWDIRSGAERWRIDEADAEFSVQARSEGREVLIVKAQPAAAEVIAQRRDVLQGTLLDEFALPPWEERVMSLSRDGAELVIAGRPMRGDLSQPVGGKPANSPDAEFRVAIVDIASGRVLQQWPAGTKLVMQATLSPSRRRVFTVDGYANLVIWDRTTQSEILHLRDQRAPIRNFAFAGERTLIAASFRENALYVLSGLPAPAPDLPDAAR